MNRSGQPGSASPSEPALVARLADAARLCGRLGHDFDNVLTGVLGFAELAQTQTDPASQPARFLTELLRAAENARAITIELHAFGRSGEVNRSATRIGDVCGALEIALGDYAPEGVQLEWKLPAGLPPVAIGPGPLNAVVGHLVRNAAEAMPDGGRVNMTARTVSLTDGLADTMPAALNSGDYVELTVADSGAGFAAGLLERVGAEPFVTTKVRHRGLGLPAVLRALDAHGGGLRIESTPRGTVVIVYLPAASLFVPTPRRHADAPVEVSLP